MQQNTRVSTYVGLGLSMLALAGCADRTKERDRGPPEFPGFGGTFGEVDGPHGSPLVRFHPGGGLIGCTDAQPAAACDNDETPTQQVVFEHAFAIGVTEVTQGEYAAVMSDNRPSAFEDCGDDCPVENLKWHQAAKFANTLSDMEGLDVCYSCIGSGRGVSCDYLEHPYECEGYRLPTEEEWEYAARCGEDKVFSGSNSAEAVAWFRRMATATQPVAQLNPTDCGTWDMSGNVYEWVHDRYGGDYTSSGVREEPVYEDTYAYAEWGSNGIYNITRGGGYNSEETNLRVSWRNYESPNDRLSKVGFRIARTVPDE